MKVVDNNAFFNLSILWFKAWQSYVLSNICYKKNIRSIFSVPYMSVRKK